VKRRAASLIVAALLAVSAVVLAGHEEARKGTRGGDRRPAPVFRRGQRLCLILDYLPAFMYTGEKLAYSFRVAKRRGVEEGIAFEVSWFFSKTEKTDKQLSPGTTKGDATRDFTVVRGFLKVPKGAKYLHFKLTSGGKNLGAGMARLVDENDKWPKGSRASWGRLVDAKGLPLILTLAERTPRVDNRWKPIKWLWEKGRSSASNVVIAGPRLAKRKKKSYQDLLAGSAKKLKIKELAEGSAGRRSAPAHGIYRLVELVESKVIPAAKAADLVVLVTPPEDPEMATEPRRYRQGLDWILSRLKRAGVGRVAIVPPLTRKIRAKQLAAYQEICRKAAAVYAKKVGARCLDVKVLKDIEYWRPPGALGKVTGKYPNDNGQKKLAELIKAAYK
jgi:hypothetical protein